MSDDKPEDDAEPTPEESPRGREKAAKAEVGPGDHDEALSSEDTELGDSDDSDQEASTDSALGSLIGGMTGLSAQAVKFAAQKTRKATFKMLKSSPEQLEMVVRAGKSLKDLREVAGVSIDDLSNAIDLNDADMLKSVEEGRAALPFEVLLRLSSYYARNDPIPFIMKYSRAYSPGIWNILKSVGLEPLVLEAERELQFLQVYRSRDEARSLSDEGFKEVLGFTRKAFEMSLHFVSQQEAKNHAPPEGDTED